MNPDRQRRILDALERRSPVGGWRRWADHPVEGWPDHALESLLVEGLPGILGVAVPPGLAQVAVRQIEFLELYVARDHSGMRRYLRALARSRRDGDIGEDVVP